MRTKLEKIKDRIMFYGTFERFGKKSGYKRTETTVLLINIEDADGTYLTDHLWFNYTTQFRELYESGQLDAGSLIEFNARSNCYVKGYQKDEFDYNLIRPTKIRVIGTDPQFLQRRPGQPPYDHQLEEQELHSTGTLGTKEWAEANYNCMKGCFHGCQYCYAFKMALRFKRVADYNQWINQQPNLQKNAIPHNKRVMFPSSHDINNDSLKIAIESIQLLLDHGNEILIVSKPHFDCIREICEKFSEYKDRIEFRFTITEYNQKSGFLKDLWEPNAPGILERIKALKWANYSGFKTSVSIEPYLENPTSIIPHIIAHVSTTIWIGIMNTTHLTKAGWELYRTKNMAAIYDKQFILENLPKWKNLAGDKLRIKDSIQHLINCDELGNIIAKSGSEKLDPPAPVKKTVTLMDFMGAKH